MNQLFAHCAVLSIQTFHRVLGHCYIIKCPNIEANELLCCKLQHCVRRSTRSFGKGIIDNK